MKEDAQSLLMKTNEQLKEKLLQWLPQQGRITTAIDGLTLSRRDTTNQAESCFYRPTIGIVAQGFKRSVIGNEEYQYGEGYCLTAGVDMPSVNHIIEASPEKPFLALSIKLDRYLVTQLAAELPPDPKNGNGSYRGVVVAGVTLDILDAFLRLVNLLDTPERIPMLAPMIIREIHYYLLIGPQGDCLRLVGTLGTQTNQIARAISWLRENYHEPLLIEKLARQVNMAESTFNRHFRKVTTLSPLQFQKRLRLYEAQRMMLADDKDAATAALKVGYESATQFNREYKRQFGEPPHRDINRMREAGIGAVGTVLPPSRE
jgi:AraC-like DNA-binding protein